MVTSYLTRYVLRTTLVRENVDYVDIIQSLSSLKGYLDSLEEVNHGCYLLYLLM